MDQWYCARHHAQAAAWALLNLQHQEFRTYYPTVQQVVIRRHRRLLIRRPVFHGYLFVFFDLSDWRWRKINSTSGIIHLLPTHAEEPVPLPVGFIEQLEAREPSAPLVVTAIQTYPEHAIVRILRGAFNSHLGKVISSGRNSTRLALKVFGDRETTLTVPTADLAEVAS